MEYIVFENGAYPKKLERRFFRYCLFRQISLLKFIFIYLLLDFARYLRIISFNKYVQKHWSFLSSVKDVKEKVDSFARRESKRVFLPNDDVKILTAHPAFIVKKLCGRSVSGNKYLIKPRVFKNFRTPEKMIADGEEYTAYGDFRSPIMKKASVKKYVVRKHVINGTRAYITRCALIYLVDLLILVAVSIVLSAASLYLGSASNADRMGLFNSYFTVGDLFLLNTLPIIALLLFLYFMFDHVSWSVLVGGLAVYALSLTNFFKIQFRSDPIWFEDIYNINEAQNMTGRYTVILSQKMILGFVLLVVGAIIIRLIFDRRIKLRYIRPVCTVLTAVAFVFLLRNVYFSETLYNNSSNPDYEKAFSTVDKYIARGFIYPLLHSITDSKNQPPDEYTAPAAEKILSEYTYEHVPEDKRVNIIGIMLEAYGDFTRYDQLEYIVDPMRHIYDLMENSYHGMLTTDIFSAGTVVTERQFLTGFTDLPTFRKFTNSYAWYLRSEGYTVNGGHPSKSWFYERRNANYFLGFEDYLFDDDYYYNKYNYHLADNYCLFGDVYDHFLESVEKNENFFSFYITYQMHGPYSDTDKYFESNFPDGFLVDKGYSSESKTIADNYFYMMDYTNEWLNYLSISLNESEEPVVLVLFGDHMPWFGNNNSVYEEFGIDLDLSTDKGFYDYYQTPYMIWANDAAKEICGDVFKGEGETMGPYFLMNKVFSLIGWKGNEYMQYMSEVAKTFQTIHTTGTAVIDGKLIKDFDPETEEYLEEIRGVQYYEKNNFKYSSLLNQTEDNKSEQ